MSTAQLPFSKLAVKESGDDLDSLAPIANTLRRFLRTAFSFWNAETGELLHVSLQQPGCNDPIRGLLCRAVRGNKPQFIVEENNFVVLAIPFTLPTRTSVVATATFATRQLTESESLDSAERFLGVSADECRSWLERQMIWSPEPLLATAEAAQAMIESEQDARRLRLEVEKLSDNLASTYEEICLLHGVTQNLRLSRDDEELGRMILEWLGDCISARSVSLQLLPVADDGQTTYRARTNSVLLNHGDTFLTSDEFAKLVEWVAPMPGGGPIVINERVTSRPDWPFPQVREIILVSVNESNRNFGWLAAVNHSEDQEFGTVEASLLNSIGAMAGVHCGNRELYRQQNEFLASVVRALSSAIDAKDPYTCGHSDRVARVAVRLAKELDRPAEELHTIYMASLLHDIGKIGINDAVLRKPGKLTDEEFDHIKQHPEIGFRILQDIQQLKSCLPAVLHHHEQWDGRGYPYKLATDTIPQIARIVAVADAFDAMSSDRPYRKGMDGTKVDQIFKDGAGKQWDPDVVAAFFRARLDITEIASKERENLTLDVEQWV